MIPNLRAALHSVGVFGHYRGYEYLISAVSMAAEDPERLKNICKEIYLPVAIEWNTSLSNVEKNIRTVRDVMMRNGGEKLLTEVAGCTFWKDKKPYPKELIGSLANYFGKQ